MGSGCRSFLLRNGQSGADAIDAEIERSLATLGAALSVDRCFTFLVSANAILRP